jgi:hypothetical protein
MALTRAEILTPAKVSLATEFVVPRFNKPMSSEVITNKSAPRDLCSVVTLVNLTPYSTDSQHFVGEQPNDEMFKQDIKGRGFLTKMPSADSRTGYAYRVIPASMFIALASEMESGWAEQERIKQEQEQLVRLKEQMRDDADVKAKELKDKTHARFRKLAIGMFGENSIGSTVWSSLDDRVTWNDDAKSYDINVGGTVSMTIEVFEQLAYLYSEWKQKEQDS